jgi:predicted TIM-barrel fold metal-dependent hydrolase
VRNLPLVDHHCHGIFRDSLDRRQFEANLCEAEAPGPLHPTLFDTQVGMAIRARCAPLLDLPAHAPPDAYLSRRAELGPDEVARRLLAATGIGTYLVDTGLAPDRVTSPAELARHTGATAHEIVRLEAVAEEVARDVAAERFPDAVAEAVTARLTDAAGAKSIAAYRGGLALDPERPSRTAVVEAAGRWLPAATSAQRRLTDPVIIRHLIWTAIDAGKPLQFHVGYGDADADLTRCRPALLTPLLRATAGLGVPIMLLHNYPFHREAAVLAQVYDHVFVDVGLALHNVGSRAGALLAELLELAPFNSVLFSSDAFGLAELYAVHVQLFRTALAAFLDDGVTREYWSAADADRIAELICAGNARRAYGLTDADRTSPAASALTSATAAAGDSSAPEA